MSFPPEPPGAAPPNSEPPWHEPADQDIAQAADHLTAAPGSVPASGLSALGPCVLRADWIASTAQLPDDRLQFLFSHWRLLAEQGGVDGLPRAAQIDGLDLAPALGNILLLDIERNGLDARYRLYGTKIASRAGRDWTGWLLSDMCRLTRTPAALLYRASYLAAARRRQPLFTEHSSAFWLPTERWQRLILPLADEAGQPIRFLVGNIGVGYRPLSEEQAEAQQRRLRPR